MAENHYHSPQSLRWTHKQDRRQSSYVWMAGRPQYLEWPSDHLEKLSNCLYWRLIRLEGPSYRLEWLSGRLQ